MNNKRFIGFRILELLLVILLLAFLVVALAPQARAAGVYVPNWYAAYSTTLTNNETRTLLVTNFADVVIPNTGEALWLQINPTNTMQTTNITAGCDVTPDGTNYTTGQPFQLSVAASGTNQVMNFTNFPAWGSAPTLNGVRKVAVTRLTNGSTNFVPITVWFSHPN